MPNNQAHDPRVVDPVDRVAAAVGLSVAPVGETDAPGAFTPMIAWDFEGETLGSANGDGWWKSDYVDTPVSDGTRSLRLRREGTESGSCPYGEGALFYGGRHSTPTLVPKGETIWQKFRMYFPSTFAFGYMYSTGDTGLLSGCGLGNGADGNVGIKFLVFSPDVGTSRTYMQITTRKEQVEQPTDARLYFLIESNSAGNAEAQYKMPLDQWIDVQFAIKVADDATGWARAWVDGNLILEAENIQTISGSANGVNEWGIGDYWNGYPWTDGEADRDAFYVDEIIVASTASGYDEPTGLDSEGNAYISPATRVADL